jgi:hypothetical protein
MIKILNLSVHTCQQELNPSDEPFKNNPNRRPFPVQELRLKKYIFYNFCDVDALLRAP